MAADYSHVILDLDGNHPQHARGPGGRRQPYLRRLTAGLIAFAVDEISRYKVGKRHAQAG